MGTYINRSKILRNLGMAGLIFCCLESRMWRKRPEDIRRRGDKVTAVPDLGACYLG